MLRSNLPTERNNLYTIEKLITDVILDSIPTVWEKIPSLQNISLDSCEFENHYVTL